MKLSKIFEARPHLKVKNGKLLVGNVSLEKLAEDYGTPLYVVDAERIAYRYKEIYSSLSKYFKDFNIAYSYKANHSLAVVSLLSKLGSGATVTSFLGIKLALNSGVPPSKIVFVGPSKSEEELREAIKKNIGLIVVESYDELLLIDEIARKLNLSANVGIRVNLNIKANVHKKIETGLISHKFGISIRDLPLLFKKCKELRNVNLIALHSHIGSQILDLRPLRKQARDLIKLFIKSIRNYGLKLSTLDFGGGVGIPYTAEQKYIKYEDYARVIHSEMKFLLRNNEIEEPKVIVEPGRYIVADSSVLLTRVNYVKKIGKSNWLLVDAGMNDFIRVALYDAYHTILPISKLNLKFNKKYNVGGPICESSDVFAYNRKLPRILPGDFLAILDVGAYGLSMASNYNLRSIPRVVIIWNNKVELVRERQDIEDIFREEKVPSFLSSYHFKATF